MQTRVYRQSLDPSVAYLQSEMRTSITPDSPHDNRHDEQRETHVEVNIEKKERKSHDS